MEVLIKPSTIKTKKFMAIFYKDGQKIKTVHFGSKDSSDYTMNKDDKRKELYLKRHQKNENWDNFMTAGSLSRYLLWNKKTLKDSFTDYLKKFKLKLYKK